MVNISSPNTPGLRDLQQGDELAHLLEGLKRCHEEQAERHGSHVPLAVKIAPDMDADEIKHVCGRLREFAVDGVIVGNTTVDRDGVAGLRHGQEQGGLSGRPLTEKADRALSAVVAEVGGQMAVIGVGGIMTPEDAANKIRLGADLVQVYTGFIYHGPDLVCGAVDAIRALPASDTK